MAGLLLAAPLVAMRFTQDVDWSPRDFLFMGVLIGCVGLGIELAARRSGNLAYRAGAVVALGAAFLLVWINAAVGVIGSENEAANLLFAVVPAIAVAGAAAARLRPRGMAWAMAGAALAQALIPPTAAALTSTPAVLVWSPQVLGLTAGFCGLWLTAAGLFRRAAARAE